MGMMPDGGLGQKRGYPGSSPYPQPNQYGGRQYGNMPYPMGGRGQNVPPNSMGGGNQYGHQVRSEFTGRSNTIDLLPKNIYYEIDCW